jgi:hypothetical protein
MLEAIRLFPRNHGVISIRVGDVHGLNRGMEVRFDLKDPNHVLIRRMPCMDRSLEERKEAEEVSSVLAYMARIESAIRVKLPEQAAPSTQC